MAEVARRELTARVISGLLLAAIVTADAVAGGWSFSLLVAIFAVLMAIEWARLAARRHGRGDLALAIAVLTATAAIAGILAGKLVGAWAALVVVSSAALVSAVVARFAGWPGAWLGLGVLYVGMGPALLVWMRNADENGLVFVLFLFASVWAADTTAFFAGRTIGGPRLAPRWSPNKTWSGFVGGVVGAGSIGLLMAVFFELPFLLGAMLLGAILGVIAQLGDLFESWIKRLAGTKDSGTLIPGHGGVLDRLDGLLFATPALALFAYLHP